MKTFYIFLSLLIFSITVNIYSQDGWFWLNPLPQGNWLRDVEFTNNNIVYVSGYGGTMLKSTDGGNNFILMENKECGSEIAFLNELTGFSSSTNGILKTTNGGNNWRFIAAPVDNVYNFSTTPQTVLYGLKDNKVYLSNDMGESWSLSLTPLTNNTINSVYFPVNSTGFAGGSKFSVQNSARIYKTTNAGSSWDTLPVISRFQVRSIFFIDQNTGFASTDNKILKTSNSGANWDTVYNISYQFNQLNFFDNNNGYLRGSQEIVYTTNQGINWNTLITMNTTFLKNINEGLGIGAINSRNFLYRTTNTGNNWSPISTGFFDDLYDVTFINTSTGFTAGLGKIYKTTNEGLNWQSYDLGINFFTAVENIMFLNQNTGYAGIDEGKLAKTTNCGLNWQVFYTGNYDHLHGMSFPSVDTGYAVTKYGFYLKTTNGGLNWAVSERDTCEYGDIQFMNNLTGFSGGASYNIHKGVIKKTNNGGTNWDVYYLGSRDVVYDLCISSQGYWYAAGYGENNANGRDGFICRSTDYGVSWQYTQLPHSIASINFSSAQTGYASANNNVTYKTTDGGNNWFPTYCINSEASQGLYFTNDNTGYGVNFYGQIIKTTTGGGVLISVEPVSYVVPRIFNLYQNYPNPFNPVTKIKFDIPKAMNASLKIYDILGREISVLVNDFLIPGTYAFDFDSRNLPSGVYFYVLKGADFSESRKMILIK